jgi:excisionase family DNA binding protein
MKKILEIYTVEEVAEALRLHEYTIRRLCREGKIPAFKVGGQWRFRKEDIENFITKSGHKWQSNLKR